jgi:hypothetical protein
MKLVLSAKLTRAVVHCSSEPPRRRSSNPRKNSKHSKSSKGQSYERSKRRRGRPAHLRSPDDTPFRDGNRDRLIGLLTDRAARTLCYYLSETNLNVYHWLAVFMKDNPIPRDGAWDDVSGENFLRKLLSMPIEGARWDLGRDPIYDHTPGCGVDPRNIAQRIMEIRTQIAGEFMQDLSDVSEENSLLLRESLTSSLSLDNVAPHPLEDA